MALPTLPTFAEAAAAQYRFNSFYTVFLVAPDGTRVYLGKTRRKSGSGLLALISGPAVQEYIAAQPWAAAATITRKTAAALELSTGHRVAFGGTIREEATR